MQVKGKYLKDENGTIISPIISASTVYNKSGINVESLTQYNNKYAMCFLGKTVQEYILNGNGNTSVNNSFYFEPKNIQTNDNNLFKLQNNQLLITFNDNKIHHIFIIWSLTVYSTYTTKKVDTWFYPCRNKTSQDKDSLNNFVPSSNYLIHDYNNLVFGCFPYMTIRDKDSITLCLDAFEYDSGTTTLQILGTPGKQIRSYFYVHIID